MQSDFPTNTRGLGRRIGQSQAFGLLAARCSSTPSHCLQSIREKRLDEPAGVSFEEFCAIRALPAPMTLLPGDYRNWLRFAKTRVRYASWTPQGFSWNWLRLVSTPSHCAFSTYPLKLASFGKSPSSPNWLRSAAAPH